MNLFRSGEHARAWNRFDPATADGIRPVADYATILFGLPRYRERLVPDYLPRIDQLSRDYPSALARLGGSSPFWRPAPVR